METINSWSDGKVLFEYEPGHLGRDIERALHSGTDLSGASLQGVDLSGVDLSGVNLRDADLRNADLRNANLTNGNLRGVDLRGVDMRGADMRGALLSGALLSDADLSGADISGLIFNYSMMGVPTIERIHTAIADAVGENGENLMMSEWHCGTTHCRAGWVVTLAGEAGAKLETSIGTAVAAALIYLASDPEIARIPDFYCKDDEALTDIKRMAEEASRNRA